MTDNVTSPIYLVDSLRTLCVNFLKRSFPNEDPQELLKKLCCAEVSQLDTSKDNAHIEAKAVKNLRALSESAL